MLLLDEIEKAPGRVQRPASDPDDGRLTDAQGRTVDFKNAVVIMTSNFGAERIRAHARRNESFEELKEDMNQLLRNTLRPEFVNRRRGDPVPLPGKGPDRRFPPPSTTLRDA